MRVCILGSSSSGNATYIESGSVKFLIDAGFSCRVLTARLSEISVDISTLDAIFVTHEHTDHIKGIKQLVKRFNLPVYTTRHTAQAIEEQLGIEPDIYIFSAGESFIFKGLTIESFPIFHDAQDPVGFIVRENDIKLSFISDLGFATTLVRQKIAGSHILIIECNHDIKMLDADPKRPWAIKQRIKSRQGHLSNESASDLIADIAHDQLDHVVLFHLSKDCNNPHRAEELIQKTLDKCGCYHTRIHQTYHDKVSAIIEYPLTISVPSTMIEQITYDQLEMTIMTP